MAHSGLKRLAKGLLWTVLALVILVLLVPVALYVPFIQDFAVGIAEKELSKSTGIDISVGKLRLGFPLRLKVSDAQALTSKTDTMLTARGLVLDVRLLPLLHGDVKVKTLRLDSAFYQMGNSDSLMWLRARVGKADLSGSDISLKGKRIDLGDALLADCRVTLRLLNDTTTKAPSDSSSVPWKINARSVRLRNVEYGMSLEGVIDTITCIIPDALLSKAAVDLAAQTVKGRSLRIDSVTASYIYPEMTAASETREESESKTSENWKITADTLSLTAKSLLYAASGASPGAGFNPSYIQGSDAKLVVTHFFNQGSNVKVPLQKMMIRERCGLSILASGLFEMNDSLMRADNFHIDTNRSQISLNASMGMGDLTSDTPVPLALEAKAFVMPADVLLAFPDMRALLAAVPSLSLNLDVTGSSQSLSVHEAFLRAGNLVNLTAEGSVDHPFDPENIGGALVLDGSVASLTKKQLPFLPLDKLPAMKIKGDVNYHPGFADGTVALTADAGRLAAKGKWVAKAESYLADIKLDAFPVSAFLPGLGIGEVTGTLHADGAGYNPMKPKARIDAKAAIEKIVYNKQTLRDVSLTASLHDGIGEGNVTSHNTVADLTADLTARLSGDTARWDLLANVAHLDLEALGVVDTVCKGHFNIVTSGWFDTSALTFDATASASDILWYLPGFELVNRPPLAIEAESLDSLLRANVVSEDLSLELYAAQNMFDLMGSLSSGMSMITSEIDSLRMNVKVLQKALPQFDMTFSSGPNNILARYLRQASGLTFSRIRAGVHIDSLLSLNAYLCNFASGDIQLDTISLTAAQHGDFLVFKSNLDNRPGTFDDFAHVMLNGFAGGNRLSLFVNQRNIAGERGFNFGISAVLSPDSTVTLKFVPYNPIIAYKPWDLNSNNFISYNLASRHLDADLALTGNDSFIKIFTQHADSLSTPSEDLAHPARQEDLIVQISRLKLQDWLSINPFAPPIAGEVSADMHINYDDGVLTGKGTAELLDLFYAKERVGTFDLGIDLSTNASGKLTADVALMVDSVKTLTAYGVVNDSTSESPFLLDFNMIKFPLKVVNPFLPPSTATLSGTLNGAMKITGTPAHPIFNGFIDFDSAKVLVNVLGTTFTLSEEKIPVDSGIVSFDGFTIMGLNKNPLTINGTVDARDLTRLPMDLSLKASDIQVVGASRLTKGSDMYGKAFLNLSADVVGDLRELNVNADLRLLSRTNVTYVLPPSESAVISQNGQEDMVTFVNFNDSLQVLDADTVAASAMSLNLLAKLHFDQGAVINAYLTTDGSNSARILPQGSLDFSMSPLNGERLTGRVNIGSGGYVRFTPPFMSVKQFEFKEGSYVAFNGNMLNPILNVSAVDQVKANVTQEGQNSRLVNFDILLNVTGTLDKMDVAFDLATDDDLTVQNELASMAPTQRANQAMNMLLYNIYSGSGTKANANLSGNQLYAFLTSRINSWAANNIKGVELSFGVDQYDKTYAGATSTATSYSYRVSKTFFDDRFKVVVGGSYSTDADADENFSQNLINDVSFEYLLNQSGTMYIRVFRHTGYESILEGEITKTGVGFVLKRKLNSLKDLFTRRRKNSNNIKVKVVK